MLVKEDVLVVGRGLVPQSLESGLGAGEGDVLGVGRGRIPHVLELGVRGVQLSLALRHWPSQRTYRVSNDRLCPFYLSKRTAVSLQNTAVT